MIILIEIIDKIIEFFLKFDNFVGFVVGLFGLIDIDKNLKIYGFIMMILKLNWVNVDLFGVFCCVFNVLMYFIIDVNSFVYGEVVVCNNVGGCIENLVYYIIGIGIGVGVI